MVFKFRIFSEENENFLRCIEIDEDDTFLSFHKAIQESVGYNQQELASFYLSNDEWERSTQITLMDMRNDDDDDLILMDKTKLSEFLTDEGETLIYVFDFLSDRVFYIVLSEVKQKNPTIKYPICSKKMGDAPQQSLLGSSSLKKLITGKIITNVKKTSTVKVSTSSTKAVTSSKPTAKPASKPDKVEKKGTLKNVKEEIPAKKGKEVEKKKGDKKAAEPSKKQGKPLPISPALMKPTKKILIDDDDDDDTLVDDDFETATSKKTGALKKQTPKKPVAQPKAKKKSDDDDDDDEDIDIEDVDVDDDEDVEVVDEYETKTDDFDDLGELDDMEDFDKFSKKFSSKKFTSIDDLESDGDEFDGEDDYYDDPMFDNIDDYNDRL